MPHDNQPDPLNHPSQPPQPDQPDQPDPNQIQTAPCPLCQNPIIFSLPIGAPFRHPQGTFLFFPHPSPIRCPECGQHYTPVLLGAQGVAWNWQPCPPPMDAPRIVPPSRNPIAFKLLKKPV